MRRRRLLLALTVLAVLLAPAVPAGAAPAAGGRSVTPMQVSGSAWDKDELVFHTSAGRYETYNVGRTGALSGMLHGADLSAWSQVVPVDIDGDRQDELLLYSASNRSFRFYDLRTDGSLGRLVNSGTWSAWSIIRAIDLDGDHRDELLFYSSNGAYLYQRVGSDGRLASRIKSGTYSQGWVEIAPVDLDGDHRDEIMFYRSNRSVAYYDISASASLGSPIRTGSYSAWTSITALDVDADAADELLFFNSSTRQYYVFNPSVSGALGTATTQGTYGRAWRVVTALNVDTPSTSMADQIVALVNAERTDRGLRPLTINTQVTAEALRWSRVQAAEERMYHRSDLFHGLPASATSVGENVAMGYRTASAVVEAWMNSSGHRANILNGRFTHIGVGVAADADGTLYFTQIFFSY